VGVRVCERWWAQAQLGGQLGAVLSGNQRRVPGVQLSSAVRRRPPVTDDHQDHHRPSPGRCSRSRLADQFRCCLSARLRLTAPLTHTQASHLSDGRRVRASTRTTPPSSSPSAIPREDHNVCSAACRVILRHRVLIANPHPPSNPPTPPLSRPRLSGVGQCGVPQPQLRADVRGQQRPQLRLDLRGRRA
jgi:hypothetical protein